MQHPDVYERALLGNRAYVPLNASIDLWSLGVTIYHVATGQLPFQSYGGRQNKEDMSVQLLFNASLIAVSITAVLRQAYLFLFIIGLRKLTIN